MRQFDPDRYREDIAELGLPESEENEYLAILWTIMKAFVDLGFGVDSVQMILPELQESASKEDADRVGLSVYRTIEERKEAAPSEPLELRDS